MQIWLLIKNLFEATVVAAAFPGILIFGSRVVFSICARLGLVGRGGGGRRWDGFASESCLYNQSDHKSRK